MDRDFLIGLFEAEQSIAHQVPMGLLKPFSVQTHDNAFSPKTGRINIDPTKSHAFYTLVIGDIYPSNEKRANVSFLWVLNANDTAAFLDDVKIQVWSDASGKKIQEPFNYKETIRDTNGKLILNVPSGLDPSTTGDPSFEIADTNFGDFLKRINKDPAFKDTDLTKKLNLLLGFHP